MKFELETFMCIILIKTTLTLTQLPINAPQAGHNAIPPPHTNQLNHLSSTLVPSSTAEFHAGSSQCTRAMLRVDVWNVSRQIQRGFQSSFVSMAQFKTDHLPRVIVKLN
jgi:hypothetical protein